MKHWFKRFMVLLARWDRARTPRRTDWRGRPVGESTGGAIPPVNLPGWEPGATLRPPSFPGENAEVRDQADDGAYQI